MAFNEPPVSFEFNIQVLQMLGQALREKYLGKTLKIREIYILHSNTAPPTLVIKSVMEDGIEIRSDIPFFKES